MTGYPHNSDGKPGPKADRLKLPGNWEDRMGEAIAKPVKPGEIPPTPGAGSKPRKAKPAGRKKKPTQ